MNMKKLIESMDRIEECGGMDEGGMMPPMGGHEGSPVSMNVSLNASGKDHVADLIDMMKNAGMQAAEPVSAKMLSPRMDMERLRGIVDGPEESIEEDADPKVASMIAKFVDEMDTDMMYYGQPDVAKVGALIKQGNIEDAAGEMADAMADQDGGSDKFDMIMQRAQEYIEDYMGDMDEAYANEPEEEYSDMKTMTKDLSGGINREKKAYAKAQDGDNAMAVEAIKAQLMAALGEKMDPVGKEDDDVDNDGDSDSSDEYLKKRRAAIAKARAKNK